MLGGHAFVAHFYYSVGLLAPPCSQRFHTSVIFKTEQLHASSFLHRLVAAYECIRIKLLETL